MPRPICGCIPRWSVSAPFEDQANQLYLSAKMPGLTHMYSGQEAVAVGICEALTPADKITSTHRGHGHCVAKGAEFRQMFCELAGQGRGLLPGQGRVDAYRRPVERQSGRQCHRRRVDGDRHGGGAERQGPGDRGCGCVFLWRWRHRAGADVRGDEHGRPVEAARHLCLREQWLFRVYQDRRDRGRLDPRPRPRLWHRGPSGGRAGCARRQYADPEASSRAPARGKARSLSSC
jgi:hypothetical protein